MQVGTNQSIISNEKKRNKKSDNVHDADVANNLATKRRKDKKPYKFNENINTSIENLLIKHQEVTGWHSAQETDVKIYFANLYHFWESGLNRSGEP